MAEPFSRLTPLIGTDAYLRLKNASVAVFGLGGVGGFVVEALARSGIGKLTLIDGDRFEESNINRQIGALYSTLKEPKSEVMLRRVKDINPEAVVKSIPLFYTGGEEIFSGGFDYIADCIDSVNAKTELIRTAVKLGIPIVSAMGAANKTDPSRFKIADIYSTKECPLAKVMRARLKAAGVRSLDVAYSDEPVVNRGGLYSFLPVTASMGLLMANKIIRELISKSD